LFALLFISCFAVDFIRFPYPGLPSKDIDSKKEYNIFRKKQQAYLLINMLRVDPQGFVEKFMKPVVADDSWRLLFKTESIRLKKFPDYYPLYQDVLLEQSATHARLGESFANVRARLINKLPKRLDGFIPGYKPLKLLAQTLMWKSKTQNDFFSYLCHGHYQDFEFNNKKNLVLGGCKPDYINRKTPRGRIRFLLRPSGAVGCNNVNTIIKDEDMFACDITYPDFTPRLRIKSPMVAGNWFSTGFEGKRIYAVVIHVPKHEKITKVQLIIDGKMIDMPMTLENGVTKVFSVAYAPLKDVPSLMKGYFFHAEINGRNFFYPAQFYYDWEEKINLTEKQRYSGYCKIPYPDRTCEICDDGFRNVNGTCVRCTKQNCHECTADLCTKCAPGFLLYNGECTTPCIENCEQCSKASYCDKCKPTHFLETVNYTCVECDKKFQDCATCTQDKCLTYFCQHTDPECDKKKTPGQYFSEITQKCEKCSEGCKQCKYSQSKGSICTICNNGLFLTKEGECIPCHYVDGCASGQCDGQQCLRCRKGYYRSGKACVRCDENCEQCIEGGKCIQCAHGFMLDKEIGKCIEYYEDENCLTKDKDGICNKCKPGFGFNKYQRCVACDASCKQCSYVDTCEVCKDTFFMSNGHCVPCSTRGCDLCDAKECFSCVSNAFLHNGVCVRGPPGCSLCHDKAPICRVCEKGMKMVNGHCVPDCNVKNCAQCNGDGTCRYCKSKLTPYGGYEPLPNASDPCPFECDPIALNCKLTEKMKVGEEEVCFADGCKECPEGTFRKDHKCNKCSKKCKKCIDEDSCLECEEGQVMFNGKCEECNTKGTCGNGEYLDGCKCKKCQIHCVACDDGGCVKCEDMFVLNNQTNKCEPCTKKTCPPKVEDICKNSSEPFSRVGDELKFDPMCIERDKNCYCLKCACNYELSTVNHTCVEIPDDKKIPFACGGEDGCATSCMEGTELVDCKCQKKCTCGKSDDGKCKEDSLTAIDNCKTINCNNNCTECLDGFRLIDGACVKCMDNCTQCHTNTTCDKCADGFYLNKTTLVCEQCRNCTGVCDQTGEVCLKCTDGQYLNETSGQCEPCGCTKCVVHEGEVLCTLCEDGSVPLDGKCGRALSLSRSGANEVSILLAVALVIVMLL